MTTPHPSMAPPEAGAPPAAPWPQTAVGIGVLLTGAALAFGAIGISSEAGYGGVGPNFLPWLVSIVLMVCGAWITWEARSGNWNLCSCCADHSTLSPQPAHASLT